MSKEVVQEIQQILFDNGFRSGAKLERAAGTRYKSAKEIETVIANIERQARIDEMNKALTVAEDNQKSPFNMMECENGKDLIYGVNEAYLHHRIKELEREE